MNSRIISIISNVSGNGKTTTALNLGMALHKLGEKTLVVDADFSKPNMMEHLEINDTPTNIQDVLLGYKHITEAIYTHPSGLSIIPSLNIGGYEKFQYHLQDLLAHYNFLILDTGEDSNLILPDQSLNEALIVHSPQHSSKYVNDAIKSLKDRKITLLGALMNRTKNSANSILGIPILTNIPEHKHIYRSYALKNPVVYTHPSSIVSKQFMHLAKLLQ